MAARVCPRPMTPEEDKAIAAPLHSRTAAIRSVQRDRIIQAAAEGQSARVIAARLKCSRPTVHA